MTEPPLSIDSRYRYGVLAAGVLAALAAWRWPFGLPTADSIEIAVLPAALVLGGLAAGYGSRSGRGLGLGAVSLPVLLHFVGSRATAPIALVFLLVATMATTRRRHGEDDSGSGGRPAGLDHWAELAGVRLLAVISAGAAWRATFTDPVDGLTSGVASGGAYLSVLVLGEVLRWSTGGRRLRWSVFDRDLLYEVGAWWVGVLAVIVFMASGWGAGISILGAVAILALELARLDRERTLAVEGARSMREVQLAGHRIIFGEAEPLAIARQIFGECRRVVSFNWFQLALLDSDGRERSWFAGPDGWVREGGPEPPPRPPALPGIHRRVQWQILERELAVPTRTLGAIRLWCDPRRQHAGAVGWLDALLPQMSASVHSALLDREARQDALTGLADRRSLEERLLHVFSQSVEGGLPMAVIMCDLDRFKRINDLYGHATGDEALKAVAGVLEAHRRDRDLCCRYGGEEFSVVLEETDGLTALRIAERLRLAVEGLKFAPQGKVIKLRVSAGVAAFPELHVKGAPELLELADEALYRAKRDGRNRCLLALGRGAFRTADGEVEDTGAAGRPQIPTLFA